MALLSNINGSWDHCLHSQWGINDSNWVHTGTSSIFLKACNDFAQLWHCVPPVGTRQMAGCVSFQVNPGFCLPSWHLLLGWLPGSVPCGLPLKISDGMGTWEPLRIPQMTWLFGDSRGVMLSGNCSLLQVQPIIEGSLEVKLPTIWRDEKAGSREKSQKRKDQKKEDAGARKGRKVAKHCFFVVLWLRRVQK